MTATLNRSNNPFFQSLGLGVTDLEIKSPNITSGVLDFIKNNVLNITDITRTSRLTEILDSYANNVSDQIYIIQNSRNKDAQGVLVDIELFQQLLISNQVIEEAIDDIVYQMALERQHDVADIEIEDVLDDMDLDFDEIMQMAKEVELD